MSKSIYEEALDILIDSLQDPQDEDCDCYMLDFEQLNNIAKTLKQAQKQEKLLELYRELNNKILHTYDIFGRMTNKEWKKFADIQQQIKELEK